MDCITEIVAQHALRHYARLRQVPDARAQRGRRYEAATVPAILLLAKLADESILSGITHWARLCESWFKAAQV